MPFDEKDALAWASTAFRDDEQARYRTYAEYMRGDHPIVLATPKFRSAFGKNFDQFSYNRMPLVVDALADRLHILGFGADDDRIAETAQDIWDGNSMDVRSGETEREQFVSGDAYEIVETDPETGDILIWPQPASMVRVHYADDRPGHVDLGVKRWRDGDGYDRLTLYHEDRIEKYRSRTKSPGDAGVVADPVHSTRTYEPHREDDEPWPIPLPVTDTVPVFHFANNAGIDHRGVSELHDVISIQDALNKSLMDLLVAMEFAAFPQRVVVNVDDREESTQEALHNFQVGIDRLINLYAMDSERPVSFGEFAAANISQYKDVIELFDVLVSRVSRVPVHYLTMTGDFPSGESQRMAEAPHITKAEDRQRSIGAVRANQMRYAVRLTGALVEPGAIRVNWASAAPLSQEESYRLALEKQRLGFPMRALLRELGYEPSQIDTIMEEQHEEALMRAQRFNAGNSDSLNGDDLRERVARVDR